VKFSNFNWIPVLFILSYHSILLVALPIYFFYFTPLLGIIIASAVLLYITGLSVTTGYHRLYSHTSYKTNPIVEGVLLFFATMAAQGSALRWAFEHRLHHAYVDTDRDPYSIKKGFWYAHFFWLLEKPKEIDQKVVADLLRNPLIRFQHRYYGLLMFLTNGLAVVLVGWFFGDYLGAFLFAWLVRLFFLHHFTWFINSLAHTWGARPYCDELSAVDNYIIALLTFGEGYHNFHHTFANDYRNGVRWYHFDPTKWVIWTLNKLGLAHSLRKNHHYFIQEKLLLERKEILLEQIKHFYDHCKEDWAEQITKLSSAMLEKLGEIKQLTNHYLGLKDEKSEGRQELRHKIKAIKKDLKKKWQDWAILSRHLMKLSPRLSANQEKISTGES
jgi:stearoyl-CoA desaturase (Delta-9 desaturase)